MGRSTGVNGNRTDNSASESGAAYVFTLGFGVGGSVSGLAIGNSITLQNNLSDDLTIDSNGDFAFSTDHRSMV